MKTDIRTEHDLHRRRRGRNYAVLAILVALIAMLFWVTIAKLGGNSANPWG